MLVDKADMDFSIRTCDNAFQDPVSMRPYYINLLDKLSLCSAFIVAEAMEVYGYAALYTNDTKEHVAYLSLIAVEKGHQGMGVGSALLGACEDIAIDSGMKSMRLEVRKDNHDAISFYGRHGFMIDNDVCSTSSYYMEKDLMNF